MEFMVSEWKIILTGILYLFCGAYWVGWRNSIDFGEGGRNEKKAPQAKLRKVA